MTTHLTSDRRAALYRSIVDDAQEIVAVIDTEFTVVLARGAVHEMLGHVADDLEGTNVADLLHPEDLDRAMMHMGGFESHGAPAGTTGFRVRHADGSWVTVDLTAARVNDGITDHLAVYCRPLDHQHAAEQVLATLLRGAGRTAALTPVLDVFSWAANEARVAIAWHETDRGWRFVGTDLPALLAGTAADQDPWLQAVTSGAPVLITDLAQLPAPVAESARAHGREAVWVVPVAFDGSEHPALITVWSGNGRGRPDGHAFGMSLAERYVELIMRWSSHVSALTSAAPVDPLTELSNRTALFEALEADEDGGALLFCDLDHFKPVNDTHGHAAGDAVLREVADRLQACVRADDVVARTGGDEFVVLARQVSSGQAAALASRIRAAVTEPIDIDGTEVSVGITIGVSYTLDPLTEQALAAADGALMSAKVHDRGTVRWAHDQPSPRTSNE